MDIRGQSLIEVILITFLFGLIGTGLIATLITSSHATQQGSQYVVASGYIQESIEAIRSIRNRDWSEITSGTYGLSTTGGTYALDATPDTVGIFTRTITVEDVYRSGSLTGDISESGVLDPSTKKITAGVVWNASSGTPQSVSSVFYVTRFNVLLSWTQDLTSEFSAGGLNSTRITTSADGEVTLALHQSDWEGLQSYYEIDLSGDGERQVVRYDEQSDIVLVLTDDEDGLVALDASDVSANAPDILRSYEVEDAQDVAVSNGYVYLALDDEDGEVVILDLADFSIVATIDLEDDASATGIAVSGTMLVIAREQDADTEEIFFYDVSDPSSPSLLGSTEVGSSLTGVVVNATYAFASSSNSGSEIYAFDLSTRAQVNTLDLPGSDSVTDIVLIGGTLYLTRSDGSQEDLYDIDVSDPIAGMTVSRALELSNSVNSLAVDFAQTYATLTTTSNSEEVMIIDLSTFSKVRSFDATGSDDALGVDVYGGYLYVGFDSDNRDLIVLGVSEGGWSDPEKVTQVDLGSTHDAKKIVVSGNFAYIVRDNNGANHDFYIYDVSTPSSPDYVGSTDLGSDLYDVVVSGDYAYVASKDNSREMIVVDVSNKAAPSEVASFNATGSDNGRSIAISGMDVYLGRVDGSDPELYAIDVSNPLAPTQRDALNFSKDINALVVLGSYLYGATDDDNKELVVFDISDPNNVSEVASYNATGSADAISLAGSGTLLLLGREGSGEDELYVLDVTTPIAPILSDSAEIGNEVSGLDIDGSFAYLATDQNDEEFQRWDISMPTAIVRTSVLDLDVDGNSIYFSLSHAFVVTDQDNFELIVVGAGSAPDDVVREGTYTSQAFDAGSSVDWDSIEWTESGTGDIVFRVRTADTQANLAMASWVGFDGTPSDTYDTSGQSLTTATGDDTRWIQFKAYFTGNGSTAPVLEDVTLYYE